MGLNYLDYSYDINKLKLPFQAELLIKELFDDSTTKEEAVLKIFEILELVVIGNSSEFKRGYDEGYSEGYSEGADDGYDSGFEAGSRDGDF